MKLNVTEQDPDGLWETESDVSEMKGKYLTFWTDRQLFGVPISHVVQIVGMQDITAIPEFPAYAKGIINLRGSIIPLIDVRLRLNKEEAAYNERTCIIVTSLGGNSVGFIVDEVDEVTVITDEQISSPPKLDGASASYITGVGRLKDKVVLLVNIQLMLGSSELDFLDEAIA